MVKPKAIFGVSGDFICRHHVEPRVKLYVPREESPGKDIAGDLWVLRAPEAGAVRSMRGGAAPDYHGHLARVKSGVACFYVLCCRTH